jgi:hypothetical protein
MAKSKAKVVITADCKFGEGNTMLLTLPRNTERAAMRAKLKKELPTITTAVVTYPDDTSEAFNYRRVK